MLPCTSHTLELQDARPVTVSASYTTDTSAVLLTRHDIPQLCMKTVLSHA